MRIAILVASCARPDMLHQTIASLQRQTCAADRVILCVSSEEDVARETSSPMD
jgi:hypothetical protein